MPSSQLAEYLLTTWVREHLTPKQQGEIHQLLTDYKLRVREEAARPVSTFLVQFLDRFEAIQAEQAEHAAAITKLYAADDAFHAALNALQHLVATTEDQTDADGHAANTTD